MGHIISTNNESTDLQSELILRVDTFEKLKKFISKTTSFDCEIDVIRGKYIIDGKSILGLMSLNILEPINVRIITEDREVIKRFNKEMEKFRIESNCK